AVLWIAFNAYDKPMTFKLPEAASPWHRVLDTGRSSPEDLPPQAEPFTATSIRLSDRSLVLLLAREVASTLRL
ncbi:MAG: glycogen-debranching protein, partial [Prochlorococcus sp.]